MENSENQKQVVIDRYSAIFILFFIAIILFFVLLKEKKIQWAFIPLIMTGIFGAVNTQLSGRLLKNKYQGTYYLKQENGCGFQKGADYKRIDGVLIPGTKNPPIYKTGNGTDITIDKTGKVHPAGFGTRFINYLDEGGYLKTAPNDCWKIK